MSSAIQPLDGDWPGVRLSQDGTVLTVTIDRPAARGALDAATMQSLTEIARRVRRSSAVQAVILTGQADYFSAGVDLQMSSSRNASEASLLELRSAVAAGPDMCQAWEEIEAITIVAIEGFCVGGAFALALACDFRIMGEGAFVRLPEVPLGMNMSWRTLPRLTALAGPARAKQVALFGDPVDAAHCLEWGIAEVACAKGEALAEARRWAARVAALPPIPARMTKEAVNAAALANAAAVSFMDRDQYLLASRSEDFREGVSAFLAKRKPEFKGN
ncbi:MAG TPA: enoyl-CoA hydratase/isomerase family protein [Novosphingobium sp.]|nr:enoyl-CoA hydratase/isomerase family protein [Novosphingobium sp.]